MLRVADASFAASIARHFECETTFSAAARAAPDFVGLTRLPGARGRVAFAGREFAIAEIDPAEIAVAGPPADAIPLAVARDSDAFALARDCRVAVSIPPAVCRCCCRFSRPGGAPPASARRLRGV